jgi:hypothetical protein
VNSPAKARGVVKPSKSGGDFSTTQPNIGSDAMPKTAMVFNRVVKWLKPSAAH